LFAYSEAKLDDIPADFRLDLVKIYIGDENIAEHTNLDNVASEHGWSVRASKPYFNDIGRTGTKSDPAPSHYFSSV
jgi:hypothetical protein